MNNDFNYNNIPNEMRSLKRWVLWKLRKIGNEKPTKIPVNANNGYGAKSNDSSTWVTFDEAISKIDFYNCSGIGFMLGNGYFGVDIDHAIDNKDLINEFVNHLQSYTEISQSGEGIHIICKGILPVGNRRKGNIEMYDNARFFALTGNLYNNLKYTVVDRTEEIKYLYNKYLADKPKEEIPDGAYVYNKPIKETENNSILTDSEVLDKAEQSQNGKLFSCLYYGQWEGIYPSQSEADMSFCSMLAFWCNRDIAQMDRIFRGSKLYREKWDKKRGANTYGEITLKNAIDNCKDVFTPAFNPKTDVYNTATGTLQRKSYYDFNDTGNAQRFIDRFGANVRYNFDNKYWMIWDGKTWIKDVKQIVKTQADIMIDEMKMELAKEQNENIAKEMSKNIKHLSSNSGKEAMLKEAMHIGSIPSINADFNQHLYFLNCRNGVINLKTGEVMEHDKKYMLSKNTNINVDMQKEPVRWIKFLEEIFDNNQEMIEYVHKAVGYTLTGDTKEQCFFQCYGDGANGKSVFLDVIYEMLGDYSLNSQVESILAKNNQSNGANSEIARMSNARFVRTNEPNENSKFNEGLVKQLVSGDVTTARFLYGTEFEFKPQFKLWIATNYKIGVRGTDYGIWRRQRLIPFKVKFEGKRMDRNLTEKLMLELPEILGWAVKGCLKWQKEGFNTPELIEKETEIYKQENDVILAFSKDCLRDKENGRERASDVFKEYSQWAKEGHEECMTQSKFGIEMAKRYKKKTVNGYVYYVGLILKKHDESYIFERDRV